MPLPALMKHRRSICFSLIAPLPSGRTFRLSILLESQLPPHQHQQLVLKSLRGSLGLLMITIPGKAGGCKRADTPEEVRLLLSLTFTPATSKLSSSPGMSLVCVWLTGDGVVAGGQPTKRQGRGSTRISLSSARNATRPVLLHCWPRRLPLPDPPPRPALRKDAAPQRPVHGASRAHSCA